LRWSVVGGALTVIVAAVLYAALALHVNPPSDIETKMSSTRSPFTIESGGTSGLHATSFIDHR